MPVVLRIKGYRFWFYEADLDEPPHVHVGRQGSEAKYWLNPIALSKSQDSANMNWLRFRGLWQSTGMRFWRRGERRR